jgi:tetratricopeptide (TPR) repeat protein
MVLGAKVRADDRDKFRAAERLHDAGRAADAWEELEPLIEFYPDEPSVQVLACRLAVAAQRDRSLVVKRCGRAADLAASDPEPHLRLAQSHAAGGDTGKAIAAAQEASRRLGKGGVAALRVELGDLYRTLGAVTWAEAAGDPEVVAWARATRARYGLPPGGPVAPDKEAAYVAAIRALLQLVYDRKFAEAEKRAGQIRRDFGDAAGVDASLCDLEIRRRKYPAARARCEKALERYPDSAWAHYLLALLDKKDKKIDAAIRHLERAIALDPELEHAYQVSADIYRTAGRTADLEKLRKAYKDKFGRDLP